MGGLSLSSEYQPPGCSILQVYFVIPVVEFSAACVAGVGPGTHFGKFDRTPRSLPVSTKFLNMAAKRFITTRNQIQGAGGGDGSVDRIDDADCLSKISRRNSTITDIYLLGRGDAVCRIWKTP